MAKLMKAQYTKLGRTELQVSQIGIGTEHLNRASQKRINEVFNFAEKAGINYVDILTASPKALEKYGKALNGRREKFIIAGHLVRKSRDYKTSNELFDHTLKLLGSDYIDVCFIQFVDKHEEYEEIMKLNGVYQLALDLKKSGKVRYIGISGHKTPVALKAVRSGKFDLIMHPVNLASKAICTPFRRGFSDEKQELLKECMVSNTGVVAMKAFWGGRLLQAGEVYTATPTQCLHYSLSQPGVDIVLTGVSKVKDLKDAAYYFESSKKEKDYSSIIMSQNKIEAVVNNCVYCNHCLPCPANIDIASINKYIDAAKNNLTEQLKADYHNIKPNALDCIQCGNCNDNCPFDMDNCSKMQKAKELFL
jgi:uncharacterized protein